LVCSSGNVLPFQRDRLPRPVGPLRIRLTHVPRIEPTVLTGRDGTVHQINRYAGVMAHRPEILRKWAELTDTIRFSGVLPAELKEEMRRATATVVGCEFCSSLGEPKSEYTDEREAAAVAFAK